MLGLAVTESARRCNSPFRATAAETDEDGKLLELLKVVLLLDEVEVDVVVEPKVLAGDVLLEVVEGTDVLLSGVGSLDADRVIRRSTTLITGVSERLKLRGEERGCQLDAGEGRERERERERGCQATLQVAGERERMPSNPTGCRREREREDAKQPYRLHERERERGCQATLQVA